MVWVERPMTSQSPGGRASADRVNPAMRQLVSVIMRSSLLCWEWTPSRLVCACRYWAITIYCDIGASTNDRYIPARTLIRPAYSANRRSLHQHCFNF